MKQVNLQFQYGEQIMEEKNEGQVMLSLNWTMFHL